MENESQPTDQEILEYSQRIKDEYANKAPLISEKEDIVILYNEYEGNGEIYTNKIQVYFKHYYYNIESIKVMYKI